MRLLKVAETTKTRIFARDLLIKTLLPNISTLIKLKSTVCNWNLLSVDKWGNQSIYWDIQEIMKLLISIIKFSKQK